MSRAYIYDKGGLVVVTNDPILAKSTFGNDMKLLWEGYASSPEHALQQFDPEGVWKAASMA